MTVATLTQEKKNSGFTLWANLVRLWKRNPAIILGVIFVTAVFLLAIFGPLIAPFDPIKQVIKSRLQAPSTIHFFGTDKFGRDIFSRILFGAQIDLKIGVICVIFPFIIGTFIGAISGYFGGVIDTVLMRIVDISVAFPFYVLLIAILAILGPGVQNMYYALIVVGWIAYAKLIRGEILIAKNMEYVLAAKALGYSPWRIMLKHLIPNIISPCIIFAMSDVVMCIISGSSLGFLGLGVQPPVPEWGVMIAEGREFITSAPWIVLFPGLAIAVVGISFSMLGDGISSLLRPTD